MSDLDEMLKAPLAETLPPLLRYYKGRKAAGDTIQVELYRPDTAPGLSDAKLVILRSENGVDQQEQRQIEWDDDLNNGLVDVGIRAVNFRQEGERFSLALRAALRKVARIYGDGYLNIVLVDLLDESDLSRTDEIAEVRRYVTTNRTDRNSRSYGECRDMIASEIGARAAQLREKLQYNPDELRAVMTTALAIYLDERFSVSNRRLFGLL